MFKLLFNFWTFLRNGGLAETLLGVFTKHDWFMRKFTAGQGCAGTTGRGMERSRRQWTHFCWRPGGGLSHLRCGTDYQGRIT